MIWNENLMRLPLRSIYKDISNGIIVKAVEVVRRESRVGGCGIKALRGEEDGGIETASRP